MSRQDPQIEVTCDGKCGDTIVVGMTPLAHRNNFDERGVPGELRQNGWVSAGDKDYCPACAEERGMA